MQPDSHAAPPWSAHQREDGRDRKHACLTPTKRSLQRGRGAKGISALLARHLDQVELVTRLVHHGPDTALIARGIAEGLHIPIASARIACMRLGCRHPDLR